MRKYLKTEITRLEAMGQRLGKERRTMIRSVLRQAYEILVNTPQCSRPHSFADGVAAATFKDCRRYPTDRQAWWISELHRQWVASGSRPGASAS
jgi:hypothetical protein